MREQNAKLRKQVRDLRGKNNLLQSFGNVDFGGKGAQAGGGDAGGGDGSGDASGHLEKLCQNDKVIQCIEKLIQKNTQDKKRDQDLYKQQHTDLKRIQEEVDKDLKQLDILEMKKKSVMKNTNEKILEK